MRLFSNFKGDLSGGLSAATITLPLSIGYGLIAFAPLGTEFAPLAVLTGLYAAIFAGFFAALFGGTPIQITGPNAPQTLVLASVVSGLAVSPHIAQESDARIVIIVALASFCILLGGACQLIFGKLRFGNLVKYVPYPVIAGFMNGIAILLVVKQLKPLMGIEADISFFEVVKHPATAQPLTLLVGFTTLLAIFLSKRFVKIIPASLMGLTAGIALYYGLQFFLAADSLGPVIGDIEVKWPKPKIFFELYHLTDHINLWKILPDLLIPGLFLGLIGSLESLLSSVVSDNVTGTYHDTNRELVGQGIGNIFCAVFGALPGAGSIVRSMANYNAGGRTRLSGMISSFLIFLIIVVIGPQVGKIPLAVIAGVIIAVGIGLFDSWTVTTLRKLALSIKQSKEVLGNLFITLAVTFITISINLTIAVGIGVAIAATLFVSKMGKSVIKRQYRGDQVHSNNMRIEEHSNMLEEFGQHIVVFELQGPLFFGSSEKLALAIRNTMKNATYCILDMKRVTEIDGTGANILLRISRMIKMEKKHLLISYLNADSPFWGFIGAMDVTKVLRKDQFFEDTDSALEWSEDHLLAHVGEFEKSSTEVTLKQMDIARDFTNQELNTLQQLLTRRTFKKGTPIFREGDEGRDLFFLKKGSVSIRAHLPESNRLKRLYKYNPGALFGELALLDGSPRSADVWADDDAEVYQLAVADFKKLRKEKPEIAIKLILNISRELSRRLRMSSQEVRAMEDN